jgi:hypothetical protein
MSGISFTDTGVIFGANVATGTNANVTIDASRATDAIALPSGTTAQRPTGSPGEIRFNNTTQSFEGFIAAWSPLGGGQLLIQNNNSLVNSTSILNFANTVSVSVIALDDPANGRITLSFSSAGGAGSINVKANDASSLNGVNNLNFNNTSTINVSVLNYQSGGTANIAFNANVKAIAGPAFDQANSAYAQANAAYNAANTAVNTSADYTWTGTHEFSGPTPQTGIGNTGFSGISIGTFNSGITSSLLFSQNTATANNGVWDVTVGSGGNFTLRAVSDDYVASSIWLQAHRVNNAITTITYGNSTDLPSHTLNGRTIITGNLSVGNTSDQTPTRGIFAVDTAGKSVGGVNITFGDFANVANNMVLYLRSNSNSNVQFAGNLVFANSTAPATPLVAINNQGFVGINTGNTSPQARLHVVGNVLITGTVNATSFVTSVGLDVTGQANLAYTAANSAANTVATFANGTLVLTNANLNFNNTSTVNVAITANGTTQTNVALNANILQIAINTAPIVNPFIYGSYSGV